MLNTPQIDSDNFYIYITSISIIFIIFSIWYEGKVASEYANNSYTYANTYAKSELEFIYNSIEGSERKFLDSNSVLINRSFKLKDTTLIFQYFSIKEGINDPTVIKKIQISNKKSKKLAINKIDKFLAFKELKRQQKLGQAIIRDLTFLKIVSIIIAVFGSGFWFFRFQIHQDKKLEREVGAIPKLEEKHKEELLKELEDRIKERVENIKTGSTNQ